MCWCKNDIDKKNNNNLKVNWLLNIECLQPNHLILMHHVSVTQSARFSTQSISIPPWPCDGQLSHCSMVC